MALKILKFAKLYHPVTEVPSMPITTIFSSCSIFKRFFSFRKQLRQQAAGRCHLTPRWRRKFPDKKLTLTGVRQLRWHEWIYIERSPGSHSKWSQAYFSILYSYLVSVYFKFHNHFNYSQLWQKFRKEKNLLFQVNFSPLYV